MHLLKEKHISCPGEVTALHRYKSLFIYYNRHVYKVFEIQSLSGCFGSRADSTSTERHYNINTSEGSVGK